MPNDCYVLFELIVPFIPEDLIERFSIDALTEDNGGGRLQIWKNGFEKYINGNAFNIAFGYGYGGVDVLGERLVTNIMHNQFLQVLFNYGLIGFVLYLWCLFNCFNNIIKNNPKYLGAFIGMLALSMTITTPPSYKPFWVLLLMAFVSDGNLKNTE